MSNYLKQLNSNLEAFNRDHYSSYKLVLDQISDAKIVLLGEASHGTHEFYAIRAQLSKYLIQEKGFNAITIEGDGPSVYTSNLYIQGEDQIADSLMALKDFKRFPQWMWRNSVMLDFIQELRSYNKTNSHKVHLYGLDLYSLHSAIEEIINYLEEYAPDAALIAKKRYSCFGNTTFDPQEYGALIKYADKKPCIEEVTKQLLELQKMSFQQTNNSLLAADKLFYATQNALLVKNAELYYRALFDSQQNTWNIRDQHMFESLQNIIAHLENKLQQEAKIIVWAHNSHIGNAKFTDMAKRGDLNIGQLVKQHYQYNSFALGFSTYTGTVTAANNWGEEAQIKAIRPALAESVEGILHSLPYPNLFLLLNDKSAAHDIFLQAKLQRAIGVIYRPETELVSHYFHGQLSQQYDALIHIDRTHALKAII